MADIKKMVKFSDADAAGVQFYGRIFEFTHAAFESFVKSKNLYNEYFASSDFAFPIIKVEADYKLPLFPGEEVTVEINMREMRQSSFSLTFKVLKEGGTLAAEVSTVIVCVDKKKWQKSLLPPLIKEMLESL